MYKRNYTIGKGERLMHQGLKIIFGDKVLFNARPDFLKNPATGYNLELDGFIPIEKLAFEYQGEHHWNGTPNNDALKRELCLKEGIRLIEIRHPKQLKNALEKLDFKVIWPIGLKRAISHYYSKKQPKRENKWQRRKRAQRKYEILQRKETMANRERALIRQSPM